MLAQGRIIPLLLTLVLILSPSGLAVAASTETPETVYLSVTFHVFEGLLDDEGPTKAGGIVGQAVDEASGVLGYRGARAVGSKTWLVRTAGDMDRLLDYRGTSIVIADRVDVRFSLVFDAAARFLTLADLELSSGEDVLLRTSVGIQEGGAAVAGVLQPPGTRQEFFIVLTSEVSDKPFPRQSAEAVFTVIDD